MSLKDSKDSIERLYGKEVLENFPNYEVFWRKFIGNPNSERPEPYDYTFPPKMSNDEKKKIEKNYEKIRITHYSLFCQLAGAHFQLRELENVKNIKDPETKYFQHWEHFEVGYFHLGSVFYLWEVFCKIMSKLKSKNIQFEPTLNGRFKNVKEDIKVVRDVLVHRGRAFTNFPHKDKFYIPLKVETDMVWSQSVKVNERIEATQKLKEDITEVEKIVNELHAQMIYEYADFIKEKNIQIEYGGKK
jgi:hypothetical protein